MLTGDQTRAAAQVMGLMEDFYVFIFLEPLMGRRWVDVTERRTKTDWAHQIKEIVDERYPEAEQIVLVMDNLNTHSPSSLYETFDPKEARRLAHKLEIHYTPKHGSWLNMAEIELSVLNRQCLDQRVPDFQTLEAEARGWQEWREEKGAKSSGASKRMMHASSSRDCTLHYRSNVLLVGLIHRSAWKMNSRKFAVASIRRRRGG
jgi:hypothetical protein